MIVDDHEMFATSLQLALSRESDMEIVGTSPDLASAHLMLAATQPDVVLLDQRLPDGTGVAALGSLRSQAPAARFVVLTGVADDATVLAATEAGCDGFVAKTSRVQELVAAVRAAASGEMLVSPALLGRLLGRLTRSSTGVGTDLTRREVEVLSLIAEGLGNSTIASRLGVSVNTVRNHVQNVLTKLGAHSKLEALAVAVREGLLPERT
jgi:DNA-binding NarL/FixJ family response regulator